MKKTASCKAIDWMIKNYSLKTRRDLGVAGQSPKVVLAAYKKRYPSKFGAGSIHSKAVSYIRRKGSLRGFASALTSKRVGKRGSRKTTKASLKGFNKKNPQGAKLLAQAMKNGIIVRFDALEFPIWMNPSAFASALIPQMKQKQQKSKKGGKNFDMNQFMRM